MLDSLIDLLRSPFSAGSSLTFFTFDLDDLDGVTHALEHMGRVSHKQIDLALKQDM